MGALANLLKKIKIPEIATLCHLRSEAVEKARS
jgi:hypothetical protein